MRFNELVSCMLAQFDVERGNEVVPLILGAPGGGKSASARETARQLLKKLGLEYVTYDSSVDNIDTATVVEFNAALRDPVDIMGTPDNRKDYTQWKAPAEMYALRAGTGPKVLILEELSDAPIPMQNAVCRIIYDRYAGSLQLTDQLYIIATGNRTEDKSGAGRLIGKLLGRTRRFDFTENLDDFVAWAQKNNVPPVLIQFLRFKPDLLAKYDPNSQYNSPTPRNWERASRVPDTLSDLNYMECVKGDVGEGAATEFTAFRKIWKELPDINEVLKKPKTAPMPTDLAVRYAIAGAIAHKATQDNFDSVLQYINRFPNKELNVMVVRDATQLCPNIRRTRAFIEWATQHAEVLM